MTTTPISTAILSFGMSGQVFHAPFINVHKGFQFTSVWERSKHLAKERYPEVKSCRTLEEILDDASIELVIVNTPNTTHFDYVKRSLEAGKHVIVEKPFTATVAEGAALLELAATKGKLLSVFHNRRWDSDFKSMRTVLAEGSLGKIVEAEIHFDRFKEELSPKAHKETALPGVGLIYDLGSHIIDQALVAFGMPEAVFADLRVVRPASVVDDCFEILLFYPELRVRLHASYYVKEPVPSYILHGTKGSFLKPRADIQEPALIAGQVPGGKDWGREPAAGAGLLHAEKDGATIRVTVTAPNGDYMEYFEGIYQAIRHGAKLPVTGEEGLNVIRVIEACLQSNSAQKRVQV